MMLEEKELMPQIIMHDLENNRVEMKKIKIILKDGTELTRIVEHVYIDLTNDADIAEKLIPDYADELEYISKVKLRNERKR